MRGRGGDVTFQGVSSYVITDILIDDIKYLSEFYNVIPRFMYSTLTF